MALPQLLDVETLFADPVFSRATLSPDGKRVAYLAPHLGRTNVWVRDLDQDHEDAVVVTHDARRGIKAYAWTADPRWMLYLQDTDGNEDWHLFRVDLDAPDAPALDLTPLDPGSRVLGMSWLRDDPHTLLVTMNKRPMFFDTFRIDIATGEAVLHRETLDPAGSYLFGPAGEAYFMKQNAEGDYEFSIADEETGELRLFYTQGGVEYPVGVLPCQVTADGKGLLLGSHGEHDDMHLVRVDAATGEVSEVARKPGHSLMSFGAQSTLITKPKTGEVLAARFVTDRTELVPLDPHFAEVLSEVEKLSDGLLGTASCDDSGQRWVVSFVHDTDPEVTWFYDHTTRESRLLFRPYPHLDPSTLAPMTPISLTARDGLPLQGFLTLPVGVEPKGLPLVLAVHGGPWAQDSWGFDREVQFLANRGYAVLQINFRGSTGYGKRHVTAALHELAGAMHDDLIDACEWAVAQGYADPRRIGIYGGSYGGYSALVGVTFTPDYFAAAVDYVGISDLSNFMRTLPPFVKPYLTNSWYAYVGDPDDPEELADMMARSPITKVDEIRTPLLVVQGANDVRVVQQEADNIVEALRSRGVPVEYLVAEDEGHGFSNPENLMAMFRLMDKHFAEHLGGRCASPS